MTRTRSSSSTFPDSVSMRIAQVMVSIGKMLSALVVGTDPLLRSLTGTLRNRALVPQSFSLAL